MKATQETQEAVKAAVEGLYRAFGRYPLRKHVEGCPCCVTNPDKQALESAPLRELSSDQLSRFAFKALTTWGDKDDLRHFLPRIFELVLSEEGIGCDVEVVFGKLALADWKSWPEPEQTALRMFFRAGWHYILSRAEPPVESDTWLCGIARAHDSLTPYLDEWATTKIRK